MTALAPRSAPSRLDRVLLELSAVLEAVAVRRMQRRAPAVAVAAPVQPALSAHDGADAAAVHIGLLPR